MVIFHVLQVQYLAGAAKCLPGCVPAWMRLPLVASRVAESTGLGATDCLRRAAAEHIAPAANELRQLTTHTQLIHRAVADPASRLCRGHVCGMWLRGGPSPAGDQNQ